MESAPDSAGLSPDELDAVASAAAWYAKYHARIIAEQADDRSAYALAQREKYIALLAGLEKLGFRMRNPLAGTSELERAA